MEVTNRGGGIGQIQILVNGKMRIDDARDVNVDNNAASASLVADLAGFMIPGQKNRIQVMAGDC